MRKIPFIDLFKSALHVSGDKLAHPQELFLTVYAAFGTIHRHCCRTVTRLRWNCSSISTNRVDSIAPCAVKIACDPHYKPGGQKHKETSTRENCNLETELFHWHYLSDRPRHK